MLENIIEWWFREPQKFEKDLILPRLLEEKLNRMELDYDPMGDLAIEILNSVHELHNERRPKIRSPRRKR